MKKAMFVLLSLVLCSSLAWGQATQSPVREDADAEGHSPNCIDPSGSCIKFNTATPLTQPVRPEVIKKIDGNLPVSGSATPTRPSHSKGIK